MPVASELPATDPGSPAGAVWHPCPRDPACPYCGGRAGGPAAPLDWSFLDGVYCISLRTRDDRMRAAAAQFHRVGLCRQVVFYRPERHPEKGIIGSWESHRAVGMHALERGHARTLILEDDVQFDRPIRPATLEAVARALDGLPPDWMIFFLGHWPVAAWFVRRNVLRTSSGCAHAYIASPRLLEWLRDHPWTKRGVAKRRIVGRALDSAFAMLPGTYAIFPMIVTQTASVSDNFTAQQKRHQKNKWRWRHLVTHTRYRELLLSRLMRPNEVAIALLSPGFYLADLARRVRTRAEPDGGGAKAGR
jgi:hypothetical protein